MKWQWRLNYMSLNCQWHVIEVGFNLHWKIKCICQWEFTRIELELVPLSSCFTATKLSSQGAFNRFHVRVNETSLNADGVWLTFNDIHCSNEVPTTLIAIQGKLNELSCIDNESSPLSIFSTGTPSEFLCNFRGILINSIHAMVFWVSIIHGCFI